MTDRQSTLRSDLPVIARFCFLIWETRPTSGKCRRELLKVIFGSTENARHETTAQSKLHGWKLRERNQWHKSARVEAAKNGNNGTVLQGVEMLHRLLWTAKRTLSTTLVNFSVVVEPTRFITDHDSVVQSSAERYQHSPTATVCVYPYLAINRFLYSAFPEYS